MENGEKIFAMPIFYSLNFDFSVVKIKAIIYSPFFIVIKNLIKMV